MSTAIVTGHDGYQWDRVAVLTLPPLAEYAARHGYAFRDVPLGQYAAGRPASWGKVPALTEALRDHDLAVWIDTDVLVVDGAPPIHQAVPDDARQALADFDVSDGLVPNCGVWAVRGPMLDVLLTVWEMTQYTDHVWWEQGALLDLLGYDPNTRPITDLGPTFLRDNTATLDPRWNTHIGDWHDGAWFLHSTPGADRERINRIRWWLTGGRP